MNKAIFLDRDGTINVDYGYVYKLDDLHFINGVEESLKRLQEAGFLLIIITNQSGVGRKYFSKEEAIEFNQHLIKQLKLKDITITDIFMCVHSPEENCNCRKPSPLLLNKAISKYNIDPEKSHMLGDKKSDVEAGNNARVMSYLISQEHNIKYWAEKILKR